MLLRNPGCPTTHKIIPPRTTCLQFLASVTIKNSARLSLFGSSHWCYYMATGEEAAQAVVGNRVLAWFRPQSSAMEKVVDVCVRSRLWRYGTTCSSTSFLCERARSTVMLHIVQEAPRPLFSVLSQGRFFWYDSSSPAMKSYLKIVPACFSFWF